MIPRRKRSYLDMTMAEIRALPPAERDVAFRSIKEIVRTIMAGTLMKKKAGNAREFDCTECGQHIVGFGPAWCVKICAHCMFQPGWFRIPQLLKMFAPDGLDNLPAHERDGAGP